MSGVDEFVPVATENALRIARPTLGPYAGVALYRLLRLVAMEDVVGRGAAATSYLAGKKLGGKLGLTSLDAFLELCDQLKIGVIKVPTMTDSLIHIDVFECVTCSGLEAVGRPLCHFEGGLIAGAIEAILGKQSRAREVTCIGGLGHETCGFDLELK